MAKITMQWQLHPRHRRRWILMECVCGWERWCANKSAAYGMAQKHLVSEEHNEPAPVSD